MLMSFIWMGIENADAVTSLWQSDEAAVDDQQHFADQILIVKKVSRDLFCSESQSTVHSLLTKLFQVIYFEFSIACEYDPGAYCTIAGPHS